MVQINQIIEKWKNKDVNALDYEEYQNEGGNKDLNVDRNIQENILKVTHNELY